LSLLTIKDSEMTVLSEFAAEGDVTEGSYAFRVGGWQNFIIISRQSLAGDWRGEFFFDKNNRQRIIEEVKPLLLGGLFREVPEGNTVIVKEGEDWIIVSAHIPRADLTIQFQNVRPTLFEWQAEIQIKHGIELNDNKGCSIAVSYETAVKILEELDKLPEENSVEANRN
jgi:hypothetical protein